jgi:hypothetical protein
MWDALSSINATIMNASGRYKNKVEPSKLNPYRQDDKNAVDNSKVVGVKALVDTFVK